MSGEQIFTTHVYKVSVPTLSTQFHIIPIGDQHIHARGHDADRYAAFLRECKALPNAHFVFMGDEFDFASSSERAALAAAKLHGSSRADFDRVILGRCKQFVEQHAWMRGRIIGMVQGNHTWRWMCSDPKRGIYEGRTSTEWLADALGCRWLGWLSYVRLRVSAPNTPVSAAIDVCLCHGKAGGKLVGTPINQVDDLRRIFPAADIYAMGHDHKRGAWPDSSLYLPSGSMHGATRIKQRRQWLVRTGSWLKAYEVDTESYVVGRLLRPAELGGVVIDCRFTRPRDGEKRVMEPDIHVRA